MPYVEILYHGKRVQGVTDLGSGRKLPIWCSVWDYYIKTPEAVKKCDSGAPIIELHVCIIACPEFWCMIDELGESWAVIIDLIEEGYIHVVELRGVDVGHKFL